MGCVLQKERAKRDGTYKSGQNMDDASDDDDNGNRPARPPKKKMNAVCRHCGKKGHSTTRSKKCLYYGQNNTTGTTNFAVVPADPILAAQDRAAAADQARMDMLPLTDDPPSDLSLNDFQDCCEWDSDIEDVGMLTGTI
jgi:hypothetical protein